MERNPFLNEGDGLDDEMAKKARELERQYEAELAALSEAEAAEIDELEDRVDDREFSGTEHQRAQFHAQKREELEVKYGMAGAAIDYEFFGVEDRVDEEKRILREIQEAEWEEMQQEENGRVERDERDEQELDFGEP